MSADQIRAEVFVRVPPDEAFALFTQHIDGWWRRGSRFRHAGPRAGLIHLEPQLGGRLFESFDDRVVEVGRVSAWQPPTRLAFTWRNANFTQDQQTEVRVHFEPREGGTQVSVVHRGWSTIPAGHSVRHGLAPAEFLGMMGRWWGEQLSSLRGWAHKPR